MSSQAPRMLEGIRVIDLTSVVFGPYATQILADLGAEVIKVEPATGDQYRHAGRSPVNRGMGPGHFALNRGKRSVVLDLKAEADAATMRELLAGADIFIHNVRGRAIERLGLGYEAVKALKPDIIYVHCVGFGSDGPYADLQAYDDVIQAASGAASLAGRVDGDPRPRYIPSLVADKVAGLHGGQAALAALVHRLRTGEGQFVEVPMLEAFTHFMLLEHLAGLTFDPQIEPAGYPRQLDPNRQPFPTADGHISIVPYTDEAVGRVFAVLGAPELLEQERFSTPRLRNRHMSEVYAEMAKLTPARTTDEWMALLGGAQIPAMPVRDLADMLDDPHLKAVGFFRDRVHPTEGGYREMRPPVRYGAAVETQPTPPPLIGQDTDAVRAELNSRA